MRLLSFALCCALMPAIARSADAQWATIKGQVVYPTDKPIPKRQPLAVDVDKPACLAKGPILDESVIVNPKNRGIKNVVVYLRPEKINATQFAKEQIHPDDLKRKPAEITITQPCCMFVDRITVARVGDTIVVKNPANIVHNFFWVSDKNGQHNPNVPSMNSWKMPAPLVAESTPIPYKCTVHPWMSGFVRIFEHPYYAVTDDDGKFEIKNAPVGKFRIVYWHETGVRGGKEGRYGEPITILGPTMEMKPIEFEVKP
jgi:hypothetical protein